MRTEQEREKQFFRDIAHTHARTHTHTHLASRDRSGLGLDSLSRWRMLRYKEGNEREDWTIPLPVCGNLRYFL